MRDKHNSMIHSPITRPFPLQVHGIIFKTIKPWILFMFQLLYFWFVPQFPPSNSDHSHHYSNHNLHSGLLQYLNHCLSLLCIFTLNVIFWYVKYHSLHLIQPPPKKDKTPPQVVSLEVRSTLELSFRCISIALFFTFLGVAVIW